MSFKNGDIVIFKSSDLKMIVIDSDVTAEYSGKLSGYVLCKWYSGNINSTNKGFETAPFKPEELILDQTD